MTSAIEAEWKKHESNFARTWRRFMMERRKLFFVAVDSGNDLRSRIEDVASSKKDREAMLKDCLLIEAAMATDQTIISLDEIVRRLFALASPNVRALREIVWVNPDNVDEQPVEWLRKGAKPERNRKLKFGIVR